MEDTLQQEKQESEYKNPNEDQGGIRCRLRDRDLLRKRKAEAEEKETNQVESQRKRPRAGDRGGAKKKGRPRKTEPTQEISGIQEEAAVPEAPAVAVVPEPAEVFPDQTSGSLPTSSVVESQPVSVPTAPAPLPVFGFPQSSVFAPFLSPPAPTKDQETAPIPVQDSAPAPDAVAVPTQTQAPDPPAAPPQVESLYVQSQGKEALDQVLIENLGPDEEEDILLSQDEPADEDLNRTPSITVPEQNKMFSVPTLSSSPPPQEYLPGNSF